MKLNELSVRAMKNRHEYPCCKYFSLNENPGAYEICPVCFWMDDPLQSRDTNCIRPTNRMSLNEARNNFRLYGAMDKRYIDFVRKPLDYEVGGSA